MYVLIKSQIKLKKLKSGSKILHRKEKDSIRNSVISKESYKSGSLANQNSLNPQAI